MAKRRSSAELCVVAGRENAHDHVTSVRADVPRTAFWTFKVHTVYRRLIFLLLTGVLALLLVWKTVRSPETPSPPAPPAIEDVRKSKPTPTRVLRPRDLEIVDATVELSQSSSSDVDDARHTVVVRNNGELAYRNVNLAFAYLTKEGKPLETRTYPISDPLLPGKTVSAREVVMKMLPKGTSKSATDHPLRRHRASRRGQVKSFLYGCATALVWRSLLRPAL